MEDWGEAVRKKGGVPSRNAYRLMGTHHPRTFEARFGSWPGVARAFKKFAKNRPEWNDVVGLVCARKSKAKCSFETASEHGGAEYEPLAKRPIYGNPMDLRGLRHEPVNEQGVVLLFGMLAEELGYIVEAIQNGFPDCEAKRRISPHRWQRVLIEFEFESRNFRDHGHPATGCDIIICWRHNWPDCPPHLEVIELSSVIKSLTATTSNC